jgi:hypothetical protein
MDSKLPKCAKSLGNWQNSMGNSRWTFSTISWANSSKISSTTPLFTTSIAFWGKKDSGKRLTLNLCARSIRNLSKQPDCKNPTSSEILKTTSSKLSQCRLKSIKSAGSHFITHILLYWIKDLSSKTFYDWPWTRSWLILTSKASAKLNCISKKSNSEKI